MSDSPSPYLIINHGILFLLEFLPQDREIHVSRRDLPSEESVFTRHLGPRVAEYAYGVDGLRYEIELEALPEQLQLGEKSQAEYDWWDWLNYWYERLFKGGDSKPVPVRLHLRQPEPYAFADLRAQVADILRRDGDCYSQYGADTAKAAGQVEKLRSLPDLLTYLTRRRFICLGYNDDGGPAYRERLKQWCAEQG